MGGFAGDAEDFGICIDGIRFLRELLGLVDGFWKLCGMLKRRDLLSIDR